MPESNKAIALRIWSEVWNARRLDLIEELYAQDFVADYRPTAPLRHGHEGIRGMVERAWIAFPDFHENLEDMIAEGDKVAVRVTITGTHLGPMGALAPTGRKVSFEEMLIERFVGGRVVWQRGIPDNRTLLTQLGILPPVPPS